jgi:hypothetical protein
MPGFSVNAISMDEIHYININTVSTIRQYDARNFITFLLFGLKMHLRKRKFARQTNVHGSLALSNVAITFLGCLEFHGLNLNNSDLRENPLTFQVNSRTTKSAAMGLCAFLKRLSNFSTTEMWRPK